MSSIFPRRGAFAAMLLICTGVLYAQQAPAPAWEFDGVSRVVAVGDIHGAYPELLALLRGTGMIDAQNRWSGGESHFVSVGDLVDRGAESRKVMDLLMRLQQEAAAAGGRVHVVPGNHEIMGVTSDLRYVAAEEFAAFAAEEDPAEREAALQAFLSQWSGEETDKAVARAEFAKTYPPGFFAHRRAFSLTGHYGKWIDSMPFLVRVNDTVFVHGGLSALIAESSGGEVNRQMRQELNEYLDRTRALIDAGLLSRTDDYGDRFRVAETRLEAAAVTDAGLEQEAGAPSATPDAAPLSAETEALLKGYVALQSALIFGPDGPLWYRGNAWCHPMWERSRLNAALTSLGARRVAVGHTPTVTRRMTTRLDGRLVMMDTGMLPYYEGRPSALEITPGGLRVYYADEDSWAEPEEESRMLGERPAGLSDEDLEVFLAEAEIVASEELGMGVTKPRRLTLSKDGITLRGVFKGEDTETSGGTGTRRDYRLNISDSYKNDIAAYRLDKFLGIDLVPVTIEREFEGESGGLQFWIENSISDLERREQNVPIYPVCNLQEQYDLMRVFDVLIYNEDRNQSNVLFDREKGLLRLIDHSRSFRTHKGRPPLYEKSELRIPGKLAVRLAELDRDKLHEMLGGLLQKKQLRAILKRRDEILRDGVVTSVGTDEKGIAD